MALPYPYLSDRNELLYICVEITSVAWAGPPPVMTMTSSKAWSEPMNASTSDTLNMGTISGSVM
ncbi:hypothetical protein D3C87_2157370 [compost metagenome]